VEAGRPRPVGWPSFCMNLPQEWLPHPTRFSLGGEHGPEAVSIHHILTGRIVPPKLYWCAYHFYASLSARMTFERNRTP